MSDEELERKVLEALKKVIDPEIGIDVVSMGLIREITVKDGKAEIKMTLTSPGCPLMNLLASMVENAAKSVEGIEEVEVKIVF